MSQVTQQRERLAREGVNYRRLLAKHQEYEQRLSTLQSRRYLSEEEKLDEVKLKKLKLAIKDRMQELLRLATD